MHVRFGCVSDALSAFYYFGRGIRLAPARTDTPTFFRWGIRRGIRWGIRLARTDTPTDPLTQNKRAFFFPLGDPSGNPLGDPFGPGPNGHPNGSPNGKKTHFS